MKKLVDFLSLFGSMGTLICCAIPSLLVVLGSGAVVASAVSTFPQLVWLSQNKIWIFSIAGILLVLNPIFTRVVARKAECPIEPGLNEACQTTKSWTRWVYPFAVGTYLIGAAATLLGFVV